MYFLQNSFRKEWKCLLLFKEWTFHSLQFKSVYRVNQNLIRNILNSYVLSILISEIISSVIALPCIKYIISWPLKLDNAWLRGPSKYNVCYDFMYTKKNNKFYKLYNYLIQHCWLESEFSKLSLRRRARQFFCKHQAFFVI